jgi:multicomponent Na+:H+ antiporter subunit E
MARILSSFVFMFLVWLGVTWTFDAGSVVFGAALALLLAYAMRNLELPVASVLLLPQRLFWALFYVPVLLVHVVRANLDVAYRVLHPALPIRPGIVRAKTSLKSPAGRVLLANSITLTPGTLSVDLVDDVLYIHRIKVPEDDPDEKTRQSLAKFEVFLRRIFE